MIQLKIIDDTVLKQQPIQSSLLPDDQKQTLGTGTALNLLAYVPVQDHFKVTFANQSFKGRNTWYVFAKHVQIIDSNGTPVQVLPDTVKLPVPYESQLDNAENPFGSCNVTSIAMCLEFFGVRARPGSQLEDQLQDWLEVRGLDRHSPTDLAAAVQAYCLRDDFHPDATISQIKHWLAGGNPVVVHGYFTSSGHVVCLTGYNDQGFIVNDPYGEWFAAGYQRNDADHPQRGKGLTYSYGMIQRTCAIEGGIWAHCISK